jgi:hypothetical protein
MVETATTTELKDKRGGNRGDPLKALKPMAKGKARKQRDLPLPKSSILERLPVLTGTSGPGPYVVTDAHRHMVTVMAANGMPIRAMASALGINPMTLKRHFRVELDQGADRINSMMGAVIVEAALDGNIAAARYWLNCHSPEAAWRRAGVDEKPEAGGEQSGSSAVKFYLPENGRDRPEVLEEREVGPITIEGRVEDAA